MAQFFFLNSLSAMCVKKANMHQDYVDKKCTFLVRWLKEDKSLMYVIRSNLEHNLRDSLFLSIVFAIKSIIRNYKKFTKRFMGQNEILLLSFLPCVTSWKMFFEKISMNLFFFFFSSMEDNRVNVVVFSNPSQAKPLEGKEISVEKRFQSHK